MSSPSSPHGEPQQQHDHPASPPARHQPSQHDSDGLSFDSSSPNNGNDTSFASTASTLTSSEPRERHPRARRKRTGAHDKQILEEAYRENTKPDKQARLEIVKRVSLTEKEVQVWFQNRRQNDRRRSRPLTPRELADLQCNGIRLIEGAGKQGSVLKVVNGPVPLVDHPGSSHSPPFSDSAAHPPPHEPANFDHGRSRSFSEAAVRTHRDIPSSQESPSASVGHSNSFSGVGYLANRRRETGSFSTPSSQTTQGYSSFSYRIEGVPRPAISPSQPGSNTSTPQSRMRISCSIEGKAELISGDEPVSSSAPDAHSPETPSHSHSHSQSSLSTFPLAPWPHQLQRSQSDITPRSSERVSLPPISSFITQPALPPRLPAGRSRDVEAWESCAASQTRDALTTFAENESKGSAAASISLIRCASDVSTSAIPARDHRDHGVLRPSSSSKRNAPLNASRDDHPAGKRARVSLTSDSAPDVAKKSHKETDEPKETDSDKENWSPDGSGRRPPSRRPLPSQPGKAPRQRNTLRDAGSRGRPSLLNARAHTAPVRRGKDGHKKVQIFVDGEQGDAELAGGDAEEEDDEVKRFMAGAAGAVSPRKAGEMDVVEGLLSLKRGAWLAR